VVNAACINAYQRIPLEVTMSSRTEPAVRSENSTCRLHPIDALANAHNGLVVMTVIITGAVELLDSLNNYQTEDGGAKRRERLTALLDDLADRSENLEVAVERQLELNSSSRVAK
jgi:hypothetical protein